jgi:serine/threonine protein kinase
VWWLERRAAGSCTVWGPDWHASADRTRIGGGRGGADPALLEGLTREAGLMAALRHPNVVLFLGACPDPPCMVTAFCARGSLLDVLARARASPVRRRCVQAAA